MSDVDFSTVEMNYHYKPKFVPTDVEHGASAYLIRTWIDLPNVGKGIPSSMFHDPMPSLQRLSRRGPLRPKLP